MTLSTAPGLPFLNIEPQPLSFFKFIAQPACRKYLYIALGGIVVQLILFKLLYPFADYFSDSYSFIQIAMTHDGFNIWPIGYSWFLYGFHQVTHSDTALVVFQYIFLEMAVLAFFYTVLYWYPLSPTVTTILFVILLFNPLSLYVSNYISSDALFTGLSISWLTCLLWMLHRPRTWQVIPHGIFLVIAFTFRYQAMYYPLVTLVVFLLSKHTKNVKYVGLAAPVIVILIFVQYTRDEAYRLTGVHQFSVLTDWHWANNALYMYEHITVDSTKVPYEAMPFHRMTKAYFDTIPDQWRNFTPRLGGIYFRHPYGPLKQYLARYDKAHPDAPSIEGWGQVAPVFGMYGKYLIKTHPGAFARFYLLPNTVNYLLPPLEKLETYNLNMSEVFPIAAQWFDYPSTKIHVASRGLSGLALFFVPMMFMMINLAFLAGFVWFVVKGYRKQAPVMWMGLALAMIVWALNAGFSILAAPMAIRYLVFPYMVFAGFAAVVGDLFVRVSEEKERASVEENVESPQSTVHSPR